jgi:glycerophosphoryl diester phosphodiesterase
VKRRARVFDERTVVVGHRGGRGDGWPAENTMAAFERAVGEGARAIEIDVRPCASGEIVVFHDETLARMTRGADSRRVAIVTFGELARVPIDGERVPRLDDVLAWAGERGVAVNVELKHDVPRLVTLARGVARLLSRRCEVLLSSFDPRLLALMAVLAPRVPRAQLTGVSQRGARAMHALASSPLLHAIHVERTQATPSNVARWKRRRLRIGVWTVNDARVARDLVALGVDYVITDRPGEILGALDATD